MNRFKLLYFVIFIINLYKIDAQISDKRLCVDEECKVPISLAKTLLRYSSPDSRILSFAPNVDITIYSKSAGSREDLWGGEINGKRGYIPKHMVRETKVFQKPTLLVDTEFTNETKQVPSKVEPNRVQEPYEVVDGTTIYLPPEEINPSSTENTVQSTALPDGTNKVTPKEPNLEILPSQEQKIETESVRQILEEKRSESDQNSVNTEEKEKIDENIEPNTEEDEDDDLLEIDDDDDDEEDEDEEENEDLEDGNDGSETIKEEFLTKETVQPTEKEETTAEIEPLIETLKENEVQTPEVTANSEVLSSKESTSVLGEDLKTEITPQSDQLLSTESDQNTEEIVASIKEEPSSSDTSTPNVEVTTLHPELEVPQPFVDTFDEVTPNPLEEVREDSKDVKATIPTLPPLGLFASSNPEHVSSSEVKNKETLDESVGQERTITPPDVKKEETVDETVGQEQTTNPPDSVEKEETVDEAVSEEQTSNSPDSVEKEETLDKIVSQEQTTIPLDDENIGFEQPTSQETIDEVVEVPETETQEDDSSKGGAEKSADDSSPEEYENNDEESGTFGFLASLTSFFGMGSEDGTDNDKSPLEEKIPDELQNHMMNIEEKHVEGDELLSKANKEAYCDAASCENTNSPVETMDIFNFNSDIFLYLVTTAVSVIIFLFGYIAFDKSKREGPLVAKINKLEKELLIVLKENQILQEKVTTDSGYETNDRVPNEVVDNLKQELLVVTNKKNSLEEQVQSLEKELENSTEVGIELNRMLSEILSSVSGSDVLKANVEHLQRQLIEQQSTINSVNETLAVTNTENHELRLELDLSNKKVFDLQAELDKMVLNILKGEEEKETQQATLENEIATLRRKYEEIGNTLRLKEENSSMEMKQLKNRFDQAERKSELKTKEYNTLSETLKQLKSVKNNDESTLRNLLEVTGIKAELQVLKTENQRFSEKLQQEQEAKLSFEKKAQVVTGEAQVLKEKYDDADKLRVEADTKLEVLSNYFKDREAQWQKEISKHEALWAEREGEATSTTERIKFMQEQLQNYKAQTESLKQEIMSQEIELKSQISVLEKKAHENWVSARQAERKLEDSKQEAAQLRHRLTLRERTIQEDKNQHRLQSPIDQNGDMPVSPLESPASPPLLYGTRDHITKSSPIPGLPPFLPPPPGVPFMPPPLHGVPPFIPPPPPNMFPGDHRPPPLGRMSSPPLNSRYSPSSRGYSPYDRNSSSPSDSEYGTSPPQRRGYSPFNSRGEDRRDFKRPPAGRSNGRNILKGGASSGSGNSNESLEKIPRQQSKV